MSLHPFLAVLGQPQRAWTISCSTGSYRGPVTASAASSPRSSLCCPLAVQQRCRQQKWQLQWKQHAWGGSPLNLRGGAAATCPSQLLPPSAARRRQPRQHRLLAAAAPAAATAAAAFWPALMQAWNTNPAAVMLAAGACILGVSLSVFLLAAIPTMLVSFADGAEAQPPPQPLAAPWGLMIDCVVKRCPAPPCLTPPPSQEGWAAGGSAGCQSVGSE